MSFVHVCLHRCYPHKTNRISINTQKINVISNFSYCSVNKITQTQTVDQQSEKRSIKTFVNPKITSMSRIAMDASHLTREKIVKHIFFVISDESMQQNIQLLLSDQ